MFAKVAAAAGFRAEVFCCFAYTGNIHNRR